VGALLMGVYRKEGETVQLIFNGRGELGTLTAIADWKGNVKGLVGNPRADPPLRADGKLNVAQAVGKGILSVVRSIPYQKEPYTGVVPIHSGEIAEDLAYYLADSEQTQSALGLGVSLNRDGSVKHAGGFLISVLPFAEEETLQQLESNLTGLSSVTEMLGSGMSPEQIAERLVQGLGLSEGSSHLVPRYGPCEINDLKQRMKNAVSTLGRAEIESILKEVRRRERTGGEATSREPLNL
jgi:molecular chaperone Hsp33